MVKAEFRGKVITLDDIFTLTKSESKWQMNLAHNLQQLVCKEKMDKEKYCRA